MIHQLSNEMRECCFTKSVEKPRMLHVVSVFSVMMWVERHVERLNCAEVGNPNQSACAHDAEDVAAVAGNFVNYAIGTHDELAKAGKVGEVFLECALGDTRAAKGEIRQIVNGGVYLEKPLCRRGDVAFGRNCVIDLVELSECSERPDDEYQIKTPFKYCHNIYRIFISF